jgi:hypothetical protein
MKIFPEMHEFLPQKVTIDEKNWGRQSDLKYSIVLPCSNAVMGLEATMKDKLFADHAQVRAQQRGVPPLILDWLITYGSAQPDQRGAEIRYFDHAARRRLSKAVGHKVVDLLGQLLHMYAVMSNDGVVITTGHRFKRISRH